MKSEVLFYLSFVFFIFGVVFFIFGSGIFDGGNKFDSDISRSTRAAHEAMSYLKRMEGHMGIYLLLNNEEDKEKFFDRFDSLQEQIDILDETVVSDYGRGELAALKEETESLYTSGEDLIEFHDNEIFGNFSMEKFESLILDVTSSADLARQHAFNIGNSDVVSLAFDLSSQSKQAETDLTLLYLTTGFDRHRVKYEDNMRLLNGTLAEFERVSVERGEYGDFLEEALGNYSLMEEYCGKLVLERSELGDDFEAVDFSEELQVCHDAASDVRRIGVFLIENVMS